MKKYNGENKEKTYVCGNCHNEIPVGVKPSKCIEPGCPAKLCSNCKSTGWWNEHWERAHAGSSVFDLDAETYDELYPEEPPRNLIAV